MITKVLLFAVFFLIESDFIMENIQHPQKYQVV